MHSWLAQVITIWALLAGSLLLLLVLITAIAVGSYLLASLGRELGINIPSFSAYEDAVRLLISMTAIMFFPYCQMKKGQVVVYFFSSKLPEKAKLWLDAFALFLTALLAAFLAYWMLLGTFQVYQDHSIFQVLSWPVWPFYLPGVVSLLLWSIISLSLAVQTIQQVAD